VLASLSDSYSKLKIISICVSRLSSYPISYFLLTISTTNYYLERNVNNFDLRFYSKQGLKDIHYSSVCTDHKVTGSTELINEKL